MSDAALRSLKAALCGILAIALFWFYTVWKDQIGDAREAVVTQRYEKQLQDQALKAGQLLAVETAKSSKTSLDLATNKVNQEISDAKNSKIVVDLRRTGADRLHDPYATTVCGRSNNAATTPDSISTVLGGTDPAQTNGLLSDQLTRFLQDQAAEADTINIAYASCRSDSLKLRKALEP